MASTSIHRASSGLQLRGLETIETAHDQTATISIPVEQLSEDRLNSAIAEAVEQRLARDMHEDQSTSVVVAYDA
jgi:hypothetical protein